MVAIDVECRWGSNVFVLPSCDPALTVAELREVASEEILVPLTRLKLIGLKTCSGRLAKDGDTLGSLRLARGAGARDGLPTLACICMGTVDAHALPPPTADAHVRDDLDDDASVAPPVDVMSPFEWLLRSGRLPAPYANLELVWSDNFEHDGPPDPARWSFDEDCNRWIHGSSHGELQQYTGAAARNAFVEGGRLVVEARREACEGCAFTSARLRTRGLGDWLYGRIEVCAKLPAAARGLWPAIWMLPTDTSELGAWPSSGEIDLAEHVGHEPGTIYASVHTALRNGRKGNHARRRANVPDAHAAYHAYALEWEPDELRFFVDGRCFLRVRRDNPSPAAWPFSRPFHLVLNLAVGGRWAGRHGIDPSAFPARLHVKYVRVFQLPQS